MPVAAVSRYEQLTADAGTSNVCSSPSCNVVLCAADIDGPAQLVHPLRNVQPVQLVVQETNESAVVLLRVTDDESGSIQYSLELACGGLGCPSENGVAVVQA